MNDSMESMLGERFQNEQLQKHYTMHATKASDTSESSAIFIHDAHYHHWNHFKIETDSGMLSLNMLCNLHCTQNTIKSDRGWALGILKRTFSAAVITLHENRLPCLLLNLHTPNPLKKEGTKWYTTSPSEKNALMTLWKESGMECETFDAMFFEDGANTFRKNSKTFLELWLTQLFDDEFSQMDVHRLIALLAKKCEYRIVIAGGLNDSSSIAIKNEVQLVN